MDKKGFTLIELLATIVIIAIIMGIVLPSAAKISRDNKNRIYEEYERMMEEYALASPLSGNNRIDLSDLEGLEKIKRECSGYVTLESTNPIKYKAHITCGDNYP